LLFSLVTQNGTVASLLRRDEWWNDVPFAEMNRKRNRSHVKEASVLPELWLKGGLKGECLAFNYHTIAMACGTKVRIEFIMV
jgi:hypothetical protein